MIAIPTFSNASYRENVTIENTVYGLLFHWNYRGRFWSVDIQDDTGATLVAGIKIVPRYGLLAPYQYKDIPQGLLMAINPSAPNRPIGRNDLPELADLLYLTKQEVERAV